MSYELPQMLQTTMLEHSDQPRFRNSNLSVQMWTSLCLFMSMTKYCQLCKEHKPLGIGVHTTDTY